MKRIISSFRCLRFVKKNYLVSKKTSLESRTRRFVSCSSQAFQELAGTMEVGGKLRELRAKNYHYWNARVKNIQLISNKGLELPFLKSLGSERGFLLVTVYQSGQCKTPFSGGQGRNWSSRGGVMDASVWLGPCLFGRDGIRWTLRTLC